MSTTTIIAEPGVQAVTVIRDLDAPCDLVFKVCSDPKHIPNWWGPRGLTTVVEAMEVRPGAGGDLSRLALMV